MLQPILKRFVETFRNPNSPHIRNIWNDIVTLTVKQRLCAATHISTTDTVTGWINAFHHWNSAGGLLASEAASTDAEQLTLDGITYPWRHSHSLPSTYNTFPMCAFADKGSARYEIMAGMLGVSVNNGAPKDYATAMQAANLSQSESVSNNDHSTYQPLPFYATYRDTTSSVSTNSLPRLYV
jgi:hypothetical protein